MEIQLEQSEQKSSHVESVAFDVNFFASGNKYKSKDSMLFLKNYVDWDKTQNASTKCCIDFIASIINPPIMVVCWNIYW